MSKFTSAARSKFRALTTTLKSAHTLFILPVLFGLLTIPALIISSQFSQPAFAAVDTNICNLDVSADVKAAAGCPSSTLPELKDIIVSIVNGIIAVVGVVAVIFVVYGGIQYITSSGESAKTQKAKNTIFYALIGLAICALSFLIVNFVIVNLISGNGAGEVTGDGTGVETVGDGNTNLVNAITNIINAIVAVLGTVCVGFMIYGGVQYMTSSGDSSKVEKAKKTLLYAGIGLVICVLAFAITNFAIKNIINGPKPPEDSAATPSH